MEHVNNAYDSIDEHFLLKSYVFVWGNTMKEWSTEWSGVITRLIKYIESSLKTKQPVEDNMFI